MHQFFAQLIPAVPPQGSPGLTPDQAGRTAALIIIVFLIGFFAVVTLIVIALMRRRARAAELRTRQKQHRPTPHVSAWEEAGKRAQAPPAEDLNDTRLGMELQPAPRSGRNRPRALVTGSSRRVGRAIAIELARAGCDVDFTYHSSASEAEALAHELAQAGCDCSFFQLDLADAGAVEAFARERAETLGRLDVLIHNAATYEPSPLDELTADACRRQYVVNALAPLLLSARLAPLLRESTLEGGGSIVALADMHAMGRPRRGFAAYAMSKAALVEMVQSVARELAPEVRVNAVAPGVVAWPESGFESDPEAQAKYLRRVPLGRAGTPEEAARAVCWLALAATYTTGEVLRVDGGRWLT